MSICNCFWFQGDSFVFPATQEIRGATGLQGPDGENVSYCHIFGHSDKTNSLPQSVVSSYFFLFLWNVISCSPHLDKNTQNDQKCQKYDLMFVAENKCFEPWECFFDWLVKRLLWLAGGECWLWLAVLGCRGWVEIQVTQACKDRRDSPDFLYVSDLKL